MNGTTTSTEYTRITHQQAVEQRLFGAVIRQDVDDVYRAYHEETRQVWDLPTEGAFFVVTKNPPGPDSDIVEIETVYGLYAGGKSGALWFREDPRDDAPQLWKLGPFAATFAFPHADGDVTVLGPQVIATTAEPQAGTVINWRGENFTARSDGPYSLPENVHPATLAALEWFGYGHLPEHVQVVSEPFSVLAHSLVAHLHATSAGAELTTALRKLIEAKDCAVRAALKTPKEA